MSLSLKQLARAVLPRNTACLLYPHGPNALSSPKKAPTAEVWPQTYTIRPSSPGPQTQGDQAKSGVGGPGQRGQRGGGKLPSRPRCPVVSAACLGRRRDTHRGVIAPAVRPSMAPQGLLEPMGLAGSPQPDSVLIKHGLERWVGGWRLGRDGSHQQIFPGLMSKDKRRARRGLEFISFTLGKRTPHPCEQTSRSLGTFSASIPALTPQLQLLRSPRSRFFLLEAPGAGVLSLPTGQLSIS